MPKLINYQRDRVRNHMVKDAFAVRQAALEKREQALATKVILLRYGDKAFEQFAIIPEGWLTPGNSVRVKYGSAYRCLTLTESRPLPFEMCNGTAWEITVPKLGKELTDIDDAWINIQTEKDQLARDLRNALAGFGTEAALRDGWPEAWAYLSPPDAPTPNLPVVRVEDLNRRIAALKEAA